MLKKIISEIISVGSGFIGGKYFTERKMKKKIADIQKLSDKHNALFMLMNQWVRVKQEGKNIADYLEKKGYHKIAIYGMSFVGDTLVSELKESSVNIGYGIDKGADNMYAEYKVVKPDDIVDKVDAVIVTAITYYDEIAGELCQRLDCPILSLEDILYEI